MRFERHGCFIVLACASDEMSMFLFVNLEEPKLRPVARPMDISSWGKTDGRLGLSMLIWPRPNDHGARNIFGAPEKSLAMGIVKQLLAFHVKCQCFDTLNGHSGKR